MSISIMTLIWGLDVPAHWQQLLMAMGDHSDDDGKSTHPSARYLAWKTGKSERQVRTLMSEFRKNGALKVIRPAAQHQPTEYFLDLSVFPKKAKYIRFPSHEVSACLDSRPEVFESRPEEAIAARPEAATSAEPSRTINIEPSGEGEGVEAENRPRPPRPPASAGFQDPAWEQDADLRDFLLTQKHVDIPLEHFSDNAWWTNASIGCNGISVKFLERVFAALGNKLTERPQTRPMNRAGWLRKMTNFLRIEREIVNREEARAAAAARKPQGTRYAYGH